LSYIDIALVIIVILGTVKGYKEGFLMELFSLLGIILGILGGFKLMGIALIYLSSEFDLDEKILPYIAFAVIFITIVLVVTLIGRSLKLYIDKSFLGRVDQAAGALLGLFKTAFLLSVVIWLLSSFHFQFPEKWSDDSKILPKIDAIAPEVAAWVGTFFPSFNDIF
jgi:membrane protein required for colicin V production